MHTHSPDLSLLEKLRLLPPDKLAQVEDFVDFLRFKNDEQKLAHAFAQASTSAFAKAWDNPDDADYDLL